MRNGRKPIDVLLLAKNDWANTGYRFWMMLLSLGLNAVMFKGEPHRMNYPKQAPLHPSLFGTPMAFYPVMVMAPGLETLIESAHVVHLLASTFPMVPVVWKGKNVVVQHGGTTYRLEPDLCNQAFEQLEPKATIIQCPDLLNLGASNEVLIHYPVDTKVIQPDFTTRKSGELVVGHFPSDPQVKGTAWILEVIKELQDDPRYRARFEYVGIENTEGAEHMVSWDENLKRMAACDVIIETIAPTNYGRPFGEWGNTALEASALGKIVITNCLNQELYAEEYGRPLPLCVANDPAAVKARLIELMDMSRIGLYQLKKMHRTWAEETHSMEATAERLWEKVYRQFFEE